MSMNTYDKRRGQLETYFDRTAMEAWKRLTSNAPVSGIRATVRAGRDRMRATLTAWLPADMHGFRLLDAGCGTGALAMEAAQRGASVVAIDLSPNLIALARERLPNNASRGRIDFRAGDMLDPSSGTMDYVVAMDSLIHYEAHDVIAALENLASRSRHGILFTFAPSTPGLELMHKIGKLFPRSDRSPAIEPIREAHLRALIAESAVLASWRITHSTRIKSGFYISHAFKLSRKRETA